MFFFLSFFFLLANKNALNMVVFYAAFRGGRNNFWNMLAVTLHSNSSSFLTVMFRATDSQSSDMMKIKS